MAILPTKETPKEPMIKVLIVEKAGGDSNWAAAFSYKAIEIPASILEKHGKQIEKSEPDILQIFENNLLKWVRSQIGL